MSSAGIVYKQHGKQALRSLVRRATQDDTVSEDTLSTVQDIFYSEFVMYVDGIATGSEQFKNGVCEFTDCTSLESRIAEFGYSPDYFADAMTIVRDAMCDTLRSIVSSCHSLPKFFNAAKTAFNNKPPRNRVIYFRWGLTYRHLIPIVERNLGCNGFFWYVVSEYKQRGGYKGLAIEKTKYVSRHAFPEEWRGLKDAELARITGVPDALFCHLSGFMISAGSKQGAMKLCTLASQWSKKG